MLLFTSCPGDESARAFNFSEDGATILADFCKRKSKPGQVGYILLSWIGEVASSNLSSTFQEMANDGSLSEQLPIVQRPAKFIDKGSQEQRWVRNSSSQDDVGPLGKRIEN